MISSMRIYLKVYSELCKIRLSFFSALSSVTGFILAGSGSAIDGILTITGIFLLACGACSLNQFQERVTDALMERTQKRPIPSGSLSPLHALYFSLAVLLSGFFLLYLMRNLSVFLLGSSAVVMYNGIYTYLKRKTAFASVPCAVIGAIPPAIGWIEGGGIFPDNKISALCFFFYIWQVTHFFLLFLSYGKDYEKAGLPSLTGIFSKKQLVRIVFIWILATAVTSLLIPLYRVISLYMVIYFMLGISIWLVYRGIALFREQKDGSGYCYVLNNMNKYVLFIMLLLSIENIFSSYLL